MIYQKFDFFELIIVDPLSLMIVFIQEAALKMNQAHSIILS